MTDIARVMKKLGPPPSIGELRSFFFFFLLGIGVSDEAFETAKRKTLEEANRED